MNPFKQRRLELNITKEEISKRVNMSIYTINDYETNRRNPSAKDVYFICKKGYEMTDEMIIEYLKYLDETRKE